MSHISKIGQLVTGDGRTCTVSDIARTYRNILNTSVPKSGKIQKLSADSADCCDFSLTTKFTTGDLDTLQRIETLKVYSLSTKTIGNVGRCIDSVKCVSNAHEVNELLSATSDNGMYSARLKSSSRETNSKQLLEIWCRSRHLKTIDISELDAHGDINTDAVFGSFVWCPFGNQDKLLYVCRPKKAKQLSFFQDSKDATLIRGEEYNHREDWGESLDGIGHTMVGILDVARDCKITTIEHNGFSLSGSQWADNGTKIVSAAYKEDPRRLGILHCNNRNSRILVHNLEETVPKVVVELSSETRCYHSPRVSNIGDKFVYLTTLLHGAHQHPCQLEIYDLLSKESKILKSDIFIADLPNYCFSKNDENILMVISDNLYLHMCLYNLRASSLDMIKFPTTDMSVLDFRSDIILASGSEVNATKTLFVAVLSSSSAADVVAWHQIEDCVHLDEIDYETFKIPTEDKSSFVSALLVSPNLEVMHSNFRLNDEEVKPVPSNQLPTVVMVHGGPHSAYMVSYLKEIVFYIRLGLKTLLINYRGSTGVNEEYLKEVCGKVGTVDIADCLHVIRHLSGKGHIDPTKLIIHGGSHGGFIACHLSCQNEFNFTSAIIRNPVVDMSTLHTTSDIPDWAYTESLGHDNYDPNWVPSSAELAKMFECSPMSRHKQAHVPTLMLLGSKDRRVPMFQGQRWADLLKAQGVEILCKVYPDKHDLAKVEVHSDTSVTAAIWILSHLDFGSSNRQK